MTDAPLTLNQVTVVGGPAIYIPHGAPMHPPSRDCPYCEVSRLTALYENERSAMQNVQKCAESYRVERDLDR